MENTNQRKFNNMDIKIYSDFYADPNYVLVGYKGKQVDAPGVIFIPYKNRISSCAFSGKSSKGSDIHRKRCR